MLLGTESRGPHQYGLLVVRLDRGSITVHVLSMRLNFLGISW